MPRPCSAAARICPPSRLRKGLQTIHNTTFQDCVSLKEIVLPVSLTTIGTSAFAGSGLTSIVLPENVSSLGSSAFANCTSLVSAKLSDLIYSIPSGLFSGCTALSSFELPAGIVTISGTAFQNCTSLLDFVIPSSIVSISADAFDGWTGGAETQYRSVGSGDAFVVDARLGRTAAARRSPTTTPAKEERKSEFFLRKGFVGLKFVGLKKGCPPACSAGGHSVVPGAFSGRSGNRADNPPFHFPPFAQGGLPRGVPLHKGAK